VQVRLQGRTFDDPHMDKREGQRNKETPLRPLDHLRPGERQGTEQHPEGRPPPDEDPGATPGKAARSPAAVETREHLEGSEQGPI
jgi:hypothetical protein